MILEIEHSEVNKLIRELIRFAGENLTQAVVNSIRERLEREKSKKHQHASIKNQLIQIGRECAALPILDSRIPEEILGYDSIGVPA